MGASHDRYTVSAEWHDCPADVDSLPLPADWMDETTEVDALAHLPMAALHTVRVSDYIESCNAQMERAAWESDIGDHGWAALLAVEVTR